MSQREGILIDQDLAYRRSPLIKRQPKVSVESIAKIGATSRIDPPLLLIAEADVNVRVRHHLILEKTDRK